MKATNLNLKYHEKDFEAMRKKKDMKGMSWEAFVFYSVMDVFYDEVNK